MRTNLCAPGADAACQETIDSELSCDLSPELLGGLNDEDFGYVFGRQLRGKEDGAELRSADPDVDFSYEELADEARSDSHWSPYDSVRVVNADP